MCASENEPSGGLLLEISIPDRGRSLANQACTERVKMGGDDGDRTTLRVGIGI